MGKHCELCGTETENYIYRFIAEQMNVIFLNNPRIINNDKEQRVIVLNDGSRLDYSWQIDENHAINFMDLSVHIFCSEKCEDNYIAKYPVFLRQNIANDVLITNWQKEKTFVPQVFQTEIFCPKDMWSKCDECAIEYPSTKEYPYIIKENVSIIIKSDIILGKLGSKPPQADDFDLTVGDMHEKNPEGNYYLYKCNLKLFIEKLFCSKECSYNYCVNNNSISVSKNNLEKGSLTVITPHTEKINEKLGNKFIYRPHILGYV